MSRLRPLLLILFVASLVLNGFVVFVPHPPSAPLFPNADKLIHATIFAVPACLGALAGLPRRALAVGLAAYAVATEIIQALVIATRDGSLGDLAADLVGLGLGLALAAAVFRARRGSAVPAAD